MSAKVAIYDDARNLLPLGERLGTGGEGSVFSIPSRAGLVAKIYHRPLSAEKQNKLLSTVRCCNESLEGIATWPVALLHQRHDGAVCGFMMPRLLDHEAVHNVYGPAHRKVKFPRADWAFLLQVARNVAAAFETIHAHGHVIGDVNQGNVFVAANAVVRMIDCDSFQIGTAGHHFSCDVGIPHFTPPELQHVASFRGLLRSVEHDNFGLAVLIFHLLFMGRHPFSGIFAGRGDMPIERAIRESRYAFGRDAGRNGMSRPNGSVGPEIASPEVAALFEQAFGAAEHGRPPARRWVEALDAIKSQVVTCGSEAMHRYYGKLSVCPWCQLEQRQGFFFFVRAIASHSPGVAGFSLQEAWRKIESARALPISLPVTPAMIRVTATPVPSRIKTSLILKNLTKALFITVALVLIVAQPRASILWIAFGFFGSGWAAKQQSAFDIERERRARRLRVAEGQWQNVEERWRVCSGEQPRELKLQELARAKEEFQQVDACYREARQRGGVMGEQYLRRCLAHFRIDESAVPGLHADQKKILTWLGISTAADIERGRIAHAYSLDKEVAVQLNTWCQRLKARLGFEPAHGADCVQAMTQRLTDLANVLCTGPQQLAMISTDCELQRRAFVPSVHEAAHALAQARADLSVMT